MTAFDSRPRVLASSKTRTFLVAGAKRFSFGAVPAPRPPTGGLQVGANKFVILPGTHRPGKEDFPAAPLGVAAHTARGRAFWMEGETLCGGVGNTLGR